MGRRKKRERRDFIRDVINGALDNVYDHFVNAYYQRGQQQNYQPEPITYEPPFETGLSGSGFRDPVVIRHVNNRFNQPAAPRAYSRRFGRRVYEYSNIEEEVYSKHPRAYSKPKPKPSSPPPPPPPSENEEEFLSRKIKEAYSMLKIDPNTATVKSVKKLRRELAMKYHSDKGGKEEIMKEINVAVDIILDHLKSKT